MSFRVNNCRLDLEDRQLLSELQQVPRAFRSYSRPEEVRVDWHRTENQGQIGSCQGNDLTSCLERCQYVAGKRPVTQLSRIFAYLATQKIDGLLYRDRGSTISGGIRLALNHGVPPEPDTGYPRSYPSRSAIDRILSPDNYEAGKPFVALSSWSVPEDPDEAKNWIGGGGAISLGIKWPGMPRDRVFRNFTGRGGGGHAIAILGYEREGNLVGVNSHNDGRFEITENAWRQMVRHRWTAAVGLSGFSDPEPIDWSLW